jgi:hypothetical protein
MGWKRPMTSKYIAGLVFMGEKSGKIIFLLVFLVKYFFSAQMAIIDYE